jgi:hypothetical protein
MKCVLQGIGTALGMALTVACLVGALPGGEQEQKGDKEAKLRAIPPGTAVLKGKVTIKGAAPNLAALTKQLHEQIERKADQKDYCLKCADFEKTPQAYRLGGPENKQVGNVFVWIAPETGTFFQIDDKQLEAAKKQEIALRQPHCAFIPHCLVHFPGYRDAENPKKLKPTGQVFKVYNDAEVTHSTNWKSLRNVGDNVIQAAGQSRTYDHVIPDKSPVYIRCDIHPWMDAWMWVFDHPYAAISLAEPKVKKDDKAFGTYEIKGLPAGKVLLFAWHEKVGYLTKGAKKGEPIELKDRETTVHDFELEVPKEDQ